MAWTSHMRGSRRVELGPVISLMESGDHRRRGMAYLAGSGHKTCLARRVWPCQVFATRPPINVLSIAFPMPWSFQCCNDVYVYSKLIGCTRESRVPDVSRSWPVGGAATCIA